MTAGVVKAFKENPGAKFVVVGQMDNNNYCRCDTCKALAEKEESPSGCVIQFANQVAEAVEKEIPGACITTAAYEWSRKPPKTLRPRDNVFITLCSIECDFGHPLATAKTKVNEDFRADIEAWGKQGETIAKYCTKGRPLYVEGRLRLDQWEDKNTKEKRSRMKVVLEQFQFLGDGRGGGENTAQTARQSRNGRRSGKPADLDYQRLFGYLQA